MHVSCFMGRLVKLAFTVTMVWDIRVLDIHHLLDAVSVLSSLSHL